MDTVDIESLKDRYAISELIGQGSFAKVYRAEIVSKPGEYVAIKSVNIQTPDKGNNNEIEAELSALKIVQSLYIVSLIGTYSSDREYWVHDKTIRINSLLTL